MPTHDEFIAGQTKVYNKFRDTTKVNAEGVKVSTGVTEKHAAYNVALRHPASITDPLAKFTERIAKCVPSIAYDAQNAHTTLFVYKLQKGQDTFTPDASVLEQLASSVTPAAAPLIDFNEWLYNHDTVLVAGQPQNAGFIECVSAIEAAGKSRGLELRLPWGSHISASRYLDARSPDQLKDFFALMKEAPALGVSKPTKIDVGHFVCNEQGFVLVPYHSIPLQ